MLRHILPILLLAVIPVPPCFAQPFVEHFEPPVVQCGKTTRVAVLGAKFGKPIGLWTSLSNGALKASPVGEQSANRAVLDITVAGDAPVGICGVRLATEDGLGNAALLLIDDLPVREAPKSDAKLTLPTAIWGRFRDAAADRFLIDVAAGQNVSFEAVANRLGKDVDPLVTIRDAKGKIVAERDNDAGLYFDCRFEHTFVQAGTYAVEIRDARFHGSDHGLYVLRMGKFPAARVAVPAVVPYQATAKRPEVRLPELGHAAVSVDALRGPTPGLFFGVLKRPGDDGSSWLPLETMDGKVTVHRDAPAEPRPPTAELHGPPYLLEDATPAVVPGILCGVLDKRAQKHLFRFEMYQGQRIQVRAEAKALNSPADLEICIVDPFGRELRRAGETPQKDEIMLDFGAGSPGVYGLSVRDVNRDGGPAFSYRLEVRTPTRETDATVQVNAETEGITVPRGSYQPLPLSVARETPNGAGKISLSLLGAPPGVTLVPDEIAEGVNSIVCKVAVAPNVPLGVHTLQILANPSQPAAINRQWAISNWQLASGLSNNPFCLWPTALSMLQTANSMHNPARLVRTRPLIDKQIINVDLIPYGLREDQLRIPPSLADRLALQITEAAPFTLVLPEPVATLPRYQHVEFPVVTTRVPGFTAPITLSAKGGQIAAKEEGRTRVYAELPTAKADQLQVTGSIHSLILTNLQKHRVDVTAVTMHEGRRISLTRNFELDVQSAYTISTEPATLKLEPGAVGKVRLLANRLKSFDGDVVVEIGQQAGLNMSEKVVIPRGQSGVDVTIQTTPDCQPGRRSAGLSASAIINRYEEEQRGRLDIDIIKPPPPPKK